MCVHTCRPERSWRGQGLNVCVSRSTQWFTEPFLQLFCMFKSGQNRVGVGWIFLKGCLRKPGKSRSRSKAQSPGKVRTRSGRTTFLLDPGRELPAHRILPVQGAGHLGSSLISHLCSVDPQLSVPNGMQIHHHGSSGVNELRVCAVWNLVALCGLK